MSVPTAAPKKTALKPLHWSKVTRAAKGSLWADTQKQENQPRWVSLCVFLSFKCFSLTYMISE